MLSRLCRSAFRSEGGPSDLVAGLAGGAVGAAVVPVAAPAALGVVGFSSAGPVAGL